MVTPKGAHTLISVKLEFNIINDMAEYEAYIIGSQATIEIGVKKLWVYKDSNMIINQLP